MLQEIMRFIDSKQEISVAGPASSKPSRHRPKTADPSRHCLCRSSENTVLDRPMTRQRTLRLPLAKKTLTGGVDHNPAAPAPLEFSLQRPQCTAASFTPSRSRPPVAILVTSLSAFDSSSRVSSSCFTSSSKPSTSA